MSDDKKLSDMFSVVSSYGELDKDGKALIDSNTISRVIAFEEPSGKVLIKELCSYIFTGTIRSVGYPYKSKKFRIMKKWANQKGYKLLKGMPDRFSIKFKFDKKDSNWRNLCKLMK